MIQDYQRCLFRLLHCYILSKVKLHPEDTDQVLQARDVQLKSISLVDEEVMMHKRIAEQYASQIKDLRETEILPLFDELAAGRGISSEALSLLKKDVLDDVHQITIQVNLHCFIIIYSYVCTSQVLIKALSQKEI